MHMLSLFIQDWKLFIFFYFYIYFYSHSRYYTGQNPFYRSNIITVLYIWSCQLLERALLDNPLEVLTTTVCFLNFQSGFCWFNSKELALCSVTNDLLMTSDSDQCSVLLLLHLCAAFNTIEHLATSTVTRRLTCNYVIQGCLMKWELWIQRSLISVFFSPV